ncbi:hypothetical protein [Cystobacter fuscus]|uniref:hypothetical protein n=1 Tax=Cystobacter fuscus TaxID=43 RepID=UPI0037C12BA0
MRLSGGYRLAVLVNSATLHPSNWVLSLQTMLEGNGRWADRLITWALFIDALYGL